MNFNIEDIEDYINGTLSEDKKSLFEQKMRTDKSFSREVADYRSILSGFGVLKDEHKIKQFIGEWESEAKIQPTAKVRTLRPYRTISIAASLLLIIGAFYFIGISPHSDWAIYANMYNDKNTSTAIKSTVVSEHPLQKGYDDYTQRNYSAAAAFFSSIPPTDTDYNTGLYYLSHSYMQNKDWANAINAINSLDSKNDIRYEEEIEWLKVLCYLRLKDNNNLSSSLKAILNNSDHAYYNNATQLNQQLDSFFRKTFF